MATIVTGVVVKNLLDDFFNKTNQTITHLGNEGRYLEMEAGVQLRQTIEAAKLAYADSLELTESKVNTTVKNTLSQLQSLVDGFQAKNKEILESLATRSQQVANSLPFHNDTPQLSIVKPRYVLRTDDSPIKFTFIGNFEHAKTLSPTLKFKTHAFQPVHVTTQQLEFSVKPSEIFSGTSNTKLISFTEGTLEIPYPSKGLLSSQLTAIFRITIGSLPPTPGTIKLDYTETLSKRVTQSKQSSNKHLDSCKYSPRHSSPNNAIGGHNNNEDQDFYLDATPGWTIIQETVGITGPTARGTYQGPKRINQNNPTRVTYNVKTEHISAGTSGIIDFCIRFEEEQNQQYPKDQTTSYDVKWGDQKTFVPAANWLSWKLTFECFDNRHIEFVGADSKDPYLKIESQGNGYAIRAVRLSELDRL